MGFFGDLGCKIGIHGWGDWQYVNAQDCTMIRRCTRCPAISEDKKVEHLLGEWHYPDEASC